MNDTLAVFKIAWEQGLVYRFNFALWRLRTVLQFLLVYFIWWTVFQTQDKAFGYSESQILTYVIILAVIRAIVFSSRATDVMNKINDGSISAFLLRPIGVIRFYLSQDLADKALNILFMIFEIGAILLIFRPAIIIQTDPFVLSLFMLLLGLGIIMWFCINMVISLLAFWIENSWGPLFLLMIFMEGLGGGLFPLDILPDSLFSILMLTPFPYLIYFPAKVYQGDFLNTLGLGYFGVFVFWVIALILLTKWILKKGLRYYTSVGS